MYIPRSLRKFLGIFIFSRNKRHEFVNAWGRTRNRGKNNVIEIIDCHGKAVQYAGNKVIAGLQLEIIGDNNLIRIHQPCHFYECEMLVEDGSVVEINTTPYTISKANFCVQHGGHLVIGKNFSTMDGLQITGFDEPDLKVSIGEDCMFSYNISFRPSDGHTVYDCSSKQVLNKGKDIFIGNHVWVGMNNVFLKGSTIPNNCVVGAHSLITKAFTEEQCIYAGVPAKKCSKTAVNWDRSDPASFKK